MKDKKGSKAIVDEQLKIIWYCSFRLPFAISAHSRFNSRPGEQHLSGSHPCWLHTAVKSLIDTTLSGNREPLVGHFGGSKYLKSHCYGKQSNLLCFHLVGVGRCLLASLVGGRSMGAHARVLSNSNIHSPFLDLRCREFL
ncbi:hypothetical protein [Bifidobacterium sp. ESL0827]|uniref:hypothetical protein n=1 Tax=Bifidobacterium sp. ESL0827 TaxID=3448583 RepID=UPI00404143C7